MATPSGLVEPGHLLEVSGLAAGQRQPDVVWAHNDSGNDTTISALGLRGEDLGLSRLDGVDATDIEDMAIVDGVVYLADIGDNDEVRDGIAIYRFDEPSPGGEIGPVETILLRYPGGPRDAEAFLVDPVTGGLFIIEKSFRLGGDSGGFFSASEAQVFTAAPPFGPDPIELRVAGSVPLDALDRLASAQPPGDALAAQVGLGGVATGADIRADGTLIALRTYATVWLFERAADQTVAEALAGTPCEAPTRPEVQGEAVAFLGPTGSGFVTVSEGANPPFNVTR